MGNVLSRHLTMKRTQNEEILQDGIKDNIP